MYSSAWAFHEKILAVLKSFVPLYTTDKYYSLQINSCIIFVILADEINPPTNLPPPPTNVPPLSTSVTPSPEVLPSNNNMVILIISAVISLVLIILCIIGILSCVQWRHKNIGLRGQHPVEMVHLNGTLIRHILQ